MLFDVVEEFQIQINSYKILQIIEFLIHIFELRARVKLI